MLVISFKDVTYSYPGTETPAIKNINLTIKEGEIIVESVPDKGSDFSVFLRLPEASMEEHADVQTQTAVKTEEADYEDAFRGRRFC